MRRLFFVGLMITAMGPFVSGQDVPDQLIYRGQMTTVAGQPVADGLVAMEFRIYDGAGGLIWGPQIFDSASAAPIHAESVSVVGGQFAVPLGRVDSNNASLEAALVGTDDLFLSIVVEGSELLPRQRILSSAFALKANRADRMGNERLALDRDSSEVMIQSGTDVVVADGNVLAEAGTVTAATLEGSGAGLTNLAAENFVDGTVDTARLPASFTVPGDIEAEGGFSGAGSLVTNIDARTITLDHLINARMPSAITVGGAVTASGGFAGDGSGLTNIDGNAIEGIVADSITVGALPNERLPTLIEPSILLTDQLNVGGTANPGTGNLSVAGRLGIGIATPSQRVHIKGITGSPNAVLYAPAYNYGTDVNRYAKLSIGSADQSIMAQTGRGLALNGHPVNFVGGDFSVDGGKPIVIEKYDMGVAGLMAVPGYPPADWTACIVGFRFDNGDIQENDTGSLVFSVYVLPTPTFYYLVAQYRAHNSVALRTVYVMFIKKKMSWDRR